MKNWKFEYMTEAQIAEVDQLMKDGHADALWAFGLECGSAGVKGYKRGAAIGTLIGVAEVGLFVGAVYFGKKLVKKYIENKAEENEPEEDVEVISTEDVGVPS